MNDVRLVEAVSADEDRIATLLERSCKERSGAFDAEEREIIHRVLREPPVGRVYLAESGNDDAGIVVLLFRPSLRRRGLVAYIDHFFVLPQLRERVTRQMFLGVIEKCRLLGVRECSVLTDIAHLDSIKLFASLGFQRVTQTALRLEL